MRTIVFLLFLLPALSIAQDVKTYIPPQAFQYFPIIKTETDRLFPGIHYPHYFPSLIEHESCISLKHSKCWNPKSRLKTAREEGAGLGQLTRTYRPDGSIRFDILQELKDKYKDELKELSWSNIYQRPDLQIRSMLLLSKQNYKSLYMVKDEFERLAMADAAYNGGLGGLQKERRACGLAKNCDPNKWFNNTERYCLKSKKPLYGNRSACDINRHHVTDVMKVRINKYEKHFK